ncbi:zinc ribbon domain-containing protein [Desulfobacterales bacterium HSG16]|nr:zinc ribbon domain-containing protein [Desulfobacterales bacterium HSG16]
MPLFDYKCEDCGKSSEALIFGADDSPKCKFCGSNKMEKLLSAHSSLSGPFKSSMPGHGDTACCGSSPGQAAGCAGPGSCCGKSFA